MGINQGKTGRAFRLGIQTRAEADGASGDALKGKFFDAFYQKRKISRD